MANLFNNIRGETCSYIFFSSADTAIFNYTGNYKEIAIKLDSLDWRPGALGHNALTYLSERTNNSVLF